VPPRPTDADPIVIHIMAAIDNRRALACTVQALVMMRLTPMLQARGGGLAVGAVGVTAQAGVKMREMLLLLKVSVVALFLSAVAGAQQEGHAAVVHLSIHFMEAKNARRSLASVFIRHAALVDWYLNIQCTKPVWLCNCFSETEKYEKRRVGNAPEETCVFRTSRCSLPITSARSPRSSSAMKK
jgi:hypothetical protein